MMRAASFRSFCSVDAGPSTPQPNHAVAPRSARIVTARIAGLSPGTSPPRVRIPITPFLPLTAIKITCLSSRNLPLDTIIELDAVTCCTAAWQLLASAELFGRARHCPTK